MSFAQKSYMGGGWICSLHWQQAGGTRHGSWESPGTQGTDAVGAPSMQLPAASLQRDCLWRALPRPEYFQITNYSICTQGSLFFLWLFCSTFLNPQWTLVKKQPLSLQCHGGSGPFHLCVGKLSSMNNRPNKSKRWDTFKWQVFAWNTIYLLNQHPSLSTNADCLMMSLARMVLTLLFFSKLLYTQYFILTLLYI